jgi:hypothetical protein
LAQKQGSKWLRPLWQQKSDASRLQTFCARKCAEDAM